MSVLLAPRGTQSAELTVDLGAIAENTSTFAARTSAAVMAVVKADGFGHGAADVARTALANGATRLGVTNVDEALALRDEGIDAPILSWLNAVDADFGAAGLAGVELAVPSREHLDAIAGGLGRGHPRPNLWDEGAPDPTRSPGAYVHLHLDTGLARDGAEPEAWSDLCRAARRAELDRTLQVVGVMGHLSHADVPGDSANSTARTRFAWGLQTARAAGLRPRWRHLAATAATLTDPLAHHTLCRIGAGLVGIDPSRTTRLRPAMTLQAPVVTVRRVRAGTPVGYGHTWTAPAATYLGLLPLGYADGLPLSASGTAHVALRGRRHPVVGRISMDQLVVDLGDDPVLPGEVATVFGPGDAGEPTVAEWATWAGTIEHEIVTRIGSRVRRRVA
ncbi:alanine racemase [Tenggerimyces flavus]|uniref:Alanine racemase n=1 Tax=Tenggerimyces flavus TaxID=1708749 RepID=A0ABV7Y881_9ACTN|nr:alanine racemase [Tenggerimyces flavus]MBM7791272.1 alanine racemase [Tenggerimyces flavus]